MTGEIMKRRFLCIAAVLLLVAGSLFAQEIVVSGSQSSVIKYELKQNIEPFQGIDVLMVSMVVPADFSSPTYSQQISDVQLVFNPRPNSEEEETDKRGNLVKRYYWDKPSKTIEAAVQLTANNQVKLKSLQSQAAFPPAVAPADVKAFLSGSKQVQSSDPAIRNKAAELTAGATTEYQAVQAVLHYVVDNMRYILVPDQYDALYAFRTGKGNCQNYSHLAAALLRSVDIPVRIVNGITLKRSYDVSVGNSEFSFEMAQGRHSWVEVYFSDLGWVPFDPQQTEFFVSNRYLRIEIGLDNDETDQDGLVRWSQTRGSGEEMPKFEEAIESDFVNDRVAISGKKTAAGPQKLLLTPALPVGRLLAVSEPQKPKPEKPAPKPPEIKKETIQKTEPEKPKQDIPAEVPKPVAKEPAEPVAPEKPAADIDYSKLTYDKSYETGNLEFPRNFDFLAARLSPEQVTASGGELRRNFLVETAEYVTGKQEYSQTFILEKPVYLKTAGLALHNFGGDGTVWLELSEDQDGRPGPPAAASRKIATRTIRISKGYDWVDFDFSKEGLVLSPGRYWLTLRFAGSPIVNWFYSYGKPVGPVDGTRSRPAGQSAWNKILSYELNYRVAGLTASSL